MTKNENIISPIKVFLSFAHADKGYKDTLLKHLILLVRRNNIQVWSDDNIVAGEDWENEILKNLHSADIDLRGAAKKQSITTFKECFLRNPNSLGALNFYFNTLLDGKSIVGNERQLRAHFKSFYSMLKNDVEDFLDYKKSRFNTGYGH